MEKRESPEVTGISAITGKVVKIRHATELDMFFIEETLRKYQLDTANLDFREFVIATENGALIGVGRMKTRGGTHEVGSVAVLEEKRGKGIGSLIVKHLIDFSGAKIIYAVTDKVNVFKRLGFVVAKEVPPALHDNLNEALKVSASQPVVLVYVRPE